MLDTSTALRHLYSRGFYHDADNLFLQTRHGRRLMNERIKKQDPDHPIVTLVRSAIDALRDDPMTGAKGVTVQYVQLDLTRPDQGIAPAIVADWKAAGWKGDIVGLSGADVSIINRGRP